MLRPMRRRCCYMPWLPDMQLQDLLLAVLDFILGLGPTLCHVFVVVHLI